MGRVPSDADRDFTAGCFIVDDGELLLIRHTKLGMWLHPGGHVEDSETPDETAKREAREETGVEVEFHGSAVPPAVEDDSYNLPQPFRVNLHRIREGHWHCDLSYLCRVDEENDATHPEEHDGLRWFSAVELRSPDYDIPENVRKTGVEAIEVVDDESMEGNR